MIEANFGFATILGAVVAELDVGEGFGVIVEVEGATEDKSEFETGGFIGVVGFSVGFSVVLSNLSVKSSL